MKEVHPSSSTFAFSVPTKSKKLSRHHTDGTLIRKQMKNKASVQQAIYIMAALSRSNWDSGEFFISSLSNR